MSAIVLEESIRIPTGIADHDAFRRWARSGQFPERGRYSFLDGDLWADLSRERLIVNLVKVEITSVLSNVSRQSQSGKVFSDGMMLTNVEAGLSTEPNAMFVSFDSLQSERVVLREGLDSLEVEGSPDMTLEVVGPSSIKKDTEVLRDLYWRAGVREYWLVNALGEQIEFDILRHAARGFVATRKQSGWIKSSVFNKSFRLVEGQDRLGGREFALEAR